MKNKGLIIYLICMGIFFLIAIRGAVFSTQRFNVKRAADHLVNEQSEMGRKTSYNDDDILTKKILPKSSLQDALNPFVWTMKQRSVNDELLQVCLDAHERYRAKAEMKYAEDLSTFEERFKEWEVNFEQAKLSLIK